MKIFLASASKNRQEIFKIAQIPVETIPAQVDEKSIQEKDFGKRAIAIARLKAEDVAKKLNQGKKIEAVVIAGDGFNICEGKILEKPKDEAEGRQMLKLLSGNETTFYSGLVMLNLATGERFEAVAASTAYFRALSPEEIEDYLESVEVTKYSAAYSPLNTKAISFITKMEGSVSGFSHSVPMDLVVQKLREWQAIKFNTE
jgi:septum formation protein